jgi:NitT/TauT family transport system ATP-binding protein
MGSNPGTILQEIVNTLPHPREYRHPEFLQKVERIHDIITGVHLPEEAPAATGHLACGPVRPVPSVNVGQMLGLLEILADRGGEEDLYAIDALTDYEFGRTIAVVKGAEMLGLVETPGDLVRLTEVGRQMVAASPKEKRLLFRRRLLTLGVFGELVRFLAHEPDRPRPGEEVRQFLAERLPAQATGDLFQTIVYWGRYGQLFEYDASVDELGLFAGREEETAVKG